MPLPLAAIVPRTLDVVDYLLLGRLLRGEPRDRLVVLAAEAVERFMFLGGGRVAPWAMAVSFFATSVSSISFMALPAMSY